MITKDYNHLITNNLRLPISNFPRNLWAQKKPDLMADRAFHNYLLMERAMDRTVNLKIDMTDILSRLANNHAYLKAIYSLLVRDLSDLQRERSDIQADRTYYLEMLDVAELYATLDRQSVIDNLQEKIEKINARLKELDELGIFLKSSSES